MKQKALNQKKRILALIPKGKVTDKKLVISFEKIDAISRKKNQIDLYELSSFLYKNKDVDFDKMNKYFKKVHSIIRKNALKSVYFNENLLQIQRNNRKDDAGFYYGKTQITKAYYKVLDHYDPNKTQSKRNLVFNWAGFWSLISTKNGKITGCFLGDTMDVELFYKALK